MTIFFLFSCQTIVRFFLIDSSDFNVCAHRTRICFNMSSSRERKICSFENALVEKNESSTRNKNGLVEGLSVFSV